MSAATNCIMYPRTSGKEIRGLCFLSIQHIKVAGWNLLPPYIETCFAVLCGMKFLSFLGPPEIIVQECALLCARV